MSRFQPSAEFLTGHPGTGASRRSFLTGTFFVLLACPVPGSLAAIYRCTDALGRVHFVQHDCPPDTRKAETTPGAGAFVAIPALSDAERKALADLAQAADARRAAAAKRRAQAARNARRQAEKAAAAAAARCTRARDDLEGLAAIRRRGYPASRARSLDRRERKLETIVRSNC